MKKLNVFTLLLALPLFGFSQAAFEKYEDMDNVGSVTINQSLIKLAGNIAAFEDNQDARDFKDLAMGLQSIKVFVTEDKGISTDMHLTVKKYIKSSSLEELMRVKDKGANVKFYIKSGKDEDHVKELLMFVSE